MIRVADEVLVDLMSSAGGIEYEEAARDVAMHQVDGVPIPFASPRLLWRMKAGTHREKDAADSGLPPLLVRRTWRAAAAMTGEGPPMAGLLFWPVDFGPLVVVHCAMARREPEALAALPTDSRLAVEAVFTGWASHAALSQVA